MVFESWIRMVINEVPWKKTFPLLLIEKRWYCRFGLTMNKNIHCLLSLYFSWCRVIYFLIFTYIFWSKSFFIYSCRYIYISLTSKIGGMIENCTWFRTSEKGILFQANDRMRNNCFGTFQRMNRFNRETGGFSRDY